MELTAEKSTLPHLDTAFGRLKIRSAGLRSEPLTARIARLRKLEEWLHASRDRIRNAVHADFKKPLLEVDTSELYPVLVELRHTLKNLERWTGAVKIDATLSYVGTFSEIRFEPKGVCLIISPWNFPFNLAVGPLVSCLAAGNVAVLKPSELTPHTSSLLREMAEECFEDDVVKVFEGGPDASTALLNQPFDHIFFTGSPGVGKIVMKAAAQHLTSVTLELGGKSPTIIDATANLKDASKRIAFGKFLNNGQTCIAPDYVLVEERVREEFINHLKERIQELFGEGKPVDENSPDYARIVNNRHFVRVNSLVTDAVQKGAVAALAGTVNEKTNFIAPVILTDITNDAKILSEEIFGPVLPVLTFKKREEVIQQVNSKPKPLAMYIFSHDRKFREYVLQNTSAGGVCINDCVLHFTHPNLPFGGVNNSGIGKSHGYYGFLAFSNEKPVLRQKSGLAGPYLLHPPYTGKMKKIVDILLKWF